MSEQFEFFWKSSSPFSNFFKCSFVDLNGVVYSSTEQYVMYKKAILFNDDISAKLILNSNNPRFAKDQGRKVTNFNQKTWVNNRELIMFQGNILKFTQNDKLKKIMLNVNNRKFVEASPYDKIWGVGMSTNNKLINDPKNWKGLNLLGVCLTKEKEVINQMV